MEREVALYGLVVGLQEGLVVLNGTTDEGRMRGDLEGVGLIRRWRGVEGNREVWESVLGRFRGLIGEEGGDGEGSK